MTGGMLTSWQAELLTSQALARKGEGRIALVTGPPACGKTRLANQLAQRARTSGDLVLSAVCSTFDKSDHLVVPRQLLGSYVQTADLAVDDVELLVSRLLGLADSYPCVVLVDDLRHADNASKLFVKQLAFSISDRPILLVCTDRLRATGDVQGLWTELAANSGFGRIPITPLSVPDVVTLAEREFNLLVDHDFAARVQKLSNGSASLAGGLLADHLERRGHPGLPRPHEEPVPGRAYRKAVLACFHALDPADRDVAEAVAIIGTLVSADIIGEIAGAVATVEDAIEDLISCGLLSGEGFCSLAAHEAVLSTMSGSRRSTLSRHAAGLLASAGAVPDDLAGWLSTLENLDPLVGDAMSTGRHPRVTTSRFVPVVPQLFADTPTRSLEFAGDVGPRRQWHSAALDRVRPGSQEPRSLWQAKDMMIGLERQIKRLNPGAQKAYAELRASQLLIGCDFPSLLPQLVAKVHPVSGRLAGHSARYGAAWSLSSVLQGGDNGELALKAAQQALTGCELAQDTSRAVLSALVTLLHENRTELAASWCDRFVTLAEDSGDISTQAELIAFSAQVALRRGDVRGAISVAEHALDLMPPPLWDIRLGTPLSTLLLANTVLGEQGAGAKHLLHRFSESLFDSRHGLHYLYARGHFYLTAGENLFALADFLRCGRLMALWKIDSQELARWQLGVAASYLARNDYDKAVSTIMEALSPPQGGPLDEETPRRCEVVFQSLLESVGTPTLLSTIETLCREAIIKVPASPVAKYKISDRYSECLDRLTLAEQQVAVLAAKGATNRAIARELSITVSTVEQHLTRSYRKLHVVGRSELRALLG